MNKDDVKRVHSQRNLKVAYAAAAAARDKPLKSSRQTGRLGQSSNALTQSLGGGGARSQSKADLHAPQANANAQQMSAQNLKLQALGGSEVRIPDYKKGETMDPAPPIEARVTAASPFKKEDYGVEPQSATQRAAYAYKDSQNGNVKVYCRFRPLNERELSTTGQKTCCQFPDSKTVTLMGINAKTGQQEPIPYNYD